MQTTRWDRAGRLGAVLAATAALAGGCASGAAAQDRPTAPSPPAASVYQVYVANESSDRVSRVVFRPGEGAEVAAEVRVGLMVADLDAPHGLSVSPDGRYWYVSLAHGTPYGRVAKYAAGTDRLLGYVELGRFPATMDLTPDGEFLYVVNFNLHGDRVPSSVSIVHTGTMLEVARPVTCVMPHGSRFSPSGRFHYSACMHSDQVVEIDAATLGVSRRFSVAPGREGPLPVDDDGRAGHHARGHAHDAAGAASSECLPTWAQPARADRAERYLYVPCSGTDEVLELALESGEVTRRWSMAGGPYNLEISPDGRLMLVTLRREGGVVVLDLETGRERARIETSRPVTHGAVVSPDGRFAFVTNEAVGSVRGTVDVIDLTRLERVASVEVGHQPGGVAYWPARD